jgi:hypothetical protein
MADLQAPGAAQLRNIENKTGMTLVQLVKLIADSGLAKVGEQRTMLMNTLGLGYGDANLLALKARDAATPKAADADPLDAIYSGSKAPLRALHEALCVQIDKLGDHESAPKKTYVSLRRKKQFAMLGPAAKGTVELGLNVSQLPPSPRLKGMPPGGMCQYTTRLSSPAEIDAELVGWVGAAYRAAG